MDRSLEPDIVMLAGDQAELMRRSVAVEALPRAEPTLDVRVDVAAGDYLGLDVTVPEGVPPDP